MRLSPTDFDALQRTLLELYQYRNVDEFRKALPGIFLKLITAQRFRCGKDFSERDRLLLNLIRPHFQQAYRNARMIGPGRRPSACALSKYDLRPREIEIAGWVANAKTNPEIAVILQ